MPLTLSPASREDIIPRLVQILFSAFATDALLTTCYPSTPANHTWWVQTIENQTQHPSTPIMKISDSATGETISFAKWSVQHRQSHDSGGTSGAVQPTDPSPDMDLPACQRLAEAQYEMRKSLLSTRSHICKSCFPSPFSNPN